MRLLSLSIQKDQHPSPKFKHFMHNVYSLRVHQPISLDCVLYTTISCQKPKHNYSKQLALNPPCVFSDRLPKCWYLHQISEFGQVVAIFECAWFVAPRHAGLEGEEWKRWRWKRLKSLDIQIWWRVQFRDNWRSRRRLPGKWPKERIGARANQTTRGKKQIGDNRFGWEEWSGWDGSCEGQLDKDASEADVDTKERTGQGALVSRQQQSWEGPEEQTHRPQGLRSA